MTQANASLDDRLRHDRSLLWWEEIQYLAGFLAGFCSWHHKLSQVIGPVIELQLTIEIVAVGPRAAITSHLIGQSRKSLNHFCNGFTKLILKLGHV